MDLNQTILSSLHSGDEQSSDDEIKTLQSSSTDHADADIDTSLASIPYSSTSVQTVYNELLLIRQRLAEENERLKKKADLLNQWEDRMRQTIEQGWQAHKDKFDGEINVYKDKLTVMTKDLKRTNESLQLLRDQNSELKRNVNELKETNEKLLEKNKQTEKRMENLIRLNQLSEQKLRDLEKNTEPSKRSLANTPNEESRKSIENLHQSIEHHSSTNSRKTTTRLLFQFIRFSYLVAPSSKAPTIASVDSLTFLFNWLSDNAQSSVSQWPSVSTLTSDTLDRYSKLLNILIDQSSFCLNKNQTCLTLSYLKLVYYSLVIAECSTITGQNRNLHSSSYRRLCDQILKCEKTQVTFFVSTKSDIF